MPQDKYEHQVIEPKWQKRWLADDAFAVSSEAEHQKTRGRYVLDMFPYPSGEGLHVGHPEGYTATDIFSRFLRMNGERVLHPMGWDAFGLPAENYAIKKGVHPRVVTEQNIANFKRQIQSLGFSYDWNREVNTTDPTYYKWTQWIFLQLFKRGLAYEKEAPIWWCPKDKTGLANEEVVNGTCDRCGSVVEKKMLKQWMLKITAYADRLLDGLNDVDWPEGIKALQRNWIGKSEGAEVKFNIPPAGNVVMLHGYTGKPEQNFFPLLKKELASYGVETAVPALPNTDNPNIPEQIEYVQRHCSFDESTTVLGLSLGTVVSLKVVENLKHPIQRLVLVAGFANPKFKDHPRPFEDSFDWKFDWKKIKKNVGSITLLHDIHDPAVSEERVQELEEKLGIQAIRVAAQEPHFDADNEPDVLQQLIQSVTVFTTRPDTLFGATYLVLSPEHELVAQITSNEQKKAVEQYVKSVAAKSDLERTSLDKEKTGVFTGAYAVNPVNDEKVPVWIADYVLSNYGTGAIMAVPAHDERDFAFAKKFDLPIKQVIAAEPSTDSLDVPMSGEGTVVNSALYDGMESADVREKIVADLMVSGRGHGAVQYKLRDWVFSRQRYWGEPIPLVHCANCKQTAESTPHYLNFYYPVIWKNLTEGRKTIETRALNPEEPDRYFGNIKSGHIIRGVFKPTGATAYFRVMKVQQVESLKALFADKRMMAAVAPTRTFSTLAELETAYEKLSPGYVKKIQQHGLIALTLEPMTPGVLPVPDEQLPLTLPEVDKYEPTGTGESPLAGITDWVNTACPSCGGPAKRETNTMPQWAGSCWYYLRYCDPKNDTAFASAEAMKAWLPVDMYVGGAEHAVLHLLYSRFWHKVLFDAGHIPGDVGDEPFRKLKNQGLILGPDGEKMSKSRGNVINPDEIVEKFGADTLRMYEMFMGPFEDAKPWDTNGILGVRRFLDKVWRAAERIDDTAANSRLHRYIQSITHGIEHFRFNTCVSDLMKWLNEMGSSAISRAEFEVFLQVLSPFAPHLSEELWSRLGHETSIAQQAWPTFDVEQVSAATVTIAVQVMGKLRGTLEMPKGSLEDVVVAAAKREPNVQKFLVGEIKKTIYVKDKLINFVV